LANKDNSANEEKKYAEVLITLIEAYEEEHYSIPDASPEEVLRTLMDANDLRQKDLAPIFGSESIVSEVLHKKRDLNKAHIEKLSKRFDVSPAVFFSRAPARGRVG
jgi:HTH-type transcriptional regulator/antitoxin HigA